MNEPQKGKIHFPNLDGLRFAGSLIIIILHIEHLKVIDGREPLKWVKFYLPAGGLDVSLFFVLSGFLIGYLLLKEKQDTGDINIRKYYTRRCLRIWPLYFLFILLGFSLFPYLGEKWGIDELNYNTTYKYLYLVLYLLFLPSGTGMRGIGAAWSVRVEELFYVMEPFFLKRTKKYLRVFLIIIIMVLLIRNGYGQFCRLLHLPSWLRHFQRLLIDYRLSCMAIGGIGAYLVVHDKQHLLRILYRKDLQWGVYILTLALLVYNINIPYIRYEFYSVLFCYIIVNLAANPKSIVRLDFKWMNYLGKTSYGLYLYGAIMRFFCLAFTEKMYEREISGWQMNAVMYFTTIASTIVVSIISYEFFEKPFLRLKNRFEVIRTKA